MRELRPEQFEKMAKTVVDRYLSNTVPLEQGVVKVALEEGLNPDQIKNLVQLANMMAHLTLFDKKQGDDKVIEFEPADPTSVLKNVYKEGPMAEEAPADSAAPDRASDMFGDLSGLVDKVKDMVGSSNSVSSSVTPSSLSTPEEESCGEEGAIETDAPAAGVSPQKKQMLIIKIRKVAEDLNDKKLQVAHEYKEELDKVASVFARLYGPDLNDFEKDAMSVRGHAALPVLSDIRRCLRLGPVAETNLVKIARVVDTDTPVMKSLDKLIKLAKEFDETVAGHQYVQKEFGRWL